MQLVYQDSKHNQKTSPALVLGTLAFGPFAFSCSGKYRSCVTLDKANSESITQEDFHHKSARLNYENNPMERQAYSWQWEFIVDDCASQNFSGVCTLKEEELEEYDYNFNPSTREVIFYLDGTSAEIIVSPDSPSSKGSVAYNISAADKAAFADILRQSKPVPEPSATLALMALSFGGLVLQPLRRKHTKI